MAADMAKFLRKKFLEAYDKTKPELDQGIIPSFEEIKEIIKDENTFSMTSTAIRPLLEDLNDAISECRVFDQKMKSISKMKYLKKMYFQRKMEKRLKEIKTSIDELSITSIDTLSNVLGDQEQISRSRTGDKESKVIGFEKHTTDFGKKLLQNNGGLEAIGIFGIHGSGKTTLALEIYDSERVRSEFSKRIYVCLSDIYRSGERKIGDNVVKLILEALGYDSQSSGDTFDSLLLILHSLLESARYLIVVDDVPIFHEFWDSFLKALPVNGAVLVTCRMREVARKIVGAENLFAIPQLEKEDCWKIFLNTVREQSVIEVDDSKLVEVKEEINDQFHGLPLAAKSLAKTVPKRIKEIPG